MRVSVILAVSLAASGKAHTAIFADGMFCRGGNDSSIDDQNTNLVVKPLYMLPKSQWWMQADRGCDKVPPLEGEYLELPAGGSLTVELANNRAFTTLSYGGRLVSDWPDGGDHPEDWHAPPGGCLNDNADGKGGELHTHNESTAAGTAWAISYESDVSQVTMKNLVVFSVAEHTPWKRLTTYEVPRDLPACPPGGCYCAWLWIPDGCGQPNMYMQNFKCIVTNTVSTKKLGIAQAPIPCKDSTAKCVRGAKQMLSWHQLDGNNVEEDIGFSPGYNSNMGFEPGAQNDIFVSDDADPPGTHNSTSAPAAITPTSTLSVQ